VAGRLSALPSTQPQDGHPDDRFIIYALEVFRSVGA
jgi:hypothetical protein